MLSKKLRGSGSASCDGIPAKSKKLTRQWQLESYGIKVA